MYKIICKAFTATGDTLTQAVEKWNRVKHSFPSYDDVQILGIESTRTFELQNELSEKLASQVMAWDLLPRCKDYVTQQFLSIVADFFTEYGPINSERWTLDELITELERWRSIASGRTCVSFVNLCFGASSLWHQTHRENFRKVDNKPEALSRWVLEHEGSVKVDFPAQVLDILQRLKAERIKSPEQGKLDHEPASENELAALISQRDKLLSTLRELAPWMSAAYDESCVELRSVFDKAFELVERPVDKAALAAYLTESIGEPVQAKDIIHVRPAKTDAADELRSAGISLNPAVQRLYELIEARHDTSLTRLALPELCYTEEGRSFVRTNLLTFPGYAPYCCNNHSGKDRTIWDPDKQQFCCSQCGWQSDFPPEFIKAYQEFRTMSQVCRKCGVTVAGNRSKYCGDGSDKDNPHSWTQPTY